MKQQLKAALAALAEAQLELERAHIASQRDQNETTCSTDTLSSALICVRGAMDATAIVLSHIRAREEIGRLVRVIP